MTKRKRTKWTTKNYTIEQHEPSLKVDHI